MRPLLSRLKQWFGDMPLFWKVYAFTVFLLVFVVGLVEAVMVPLAKIALEGIYGGFQAWHEVILWAVSILIPSMACGYILSKVLAGKLGKMVQASRALARGNLEVRLPVYGNENDAFDVLARNLNEMADAIKQQRQHERRLLADISHELRSPLTRMTVATDLFSRRYKDEESTVIARRLEKEVAQMNEMVAMLLSQARDKLMAAGENKVHDLSGMLEQLAEDFAFQGEVKKMRVEASISGALEVYGNTMQLERMLGNILSNAIFYGPEDSKIFIKAYSKNGDVVISIRDEGPGVPEAQLEDIFRPFHRVDSSRTRSSGGAGLGLALAMEAAIQHGGHISAFNASPGLEVQVTLPACSQDLD